MRVTPSGARRQPGRVRRRRRAHDLERRLAAGPQREAEGALRDEDLQTVDRVRPAGRGGGKQRGGS